MDLNLYNQMIIVQDNPKFSSYFCGGGPSNVAGGGGGRMLQQ
jgi:hypothetical protein